MIIGLGIDSVNTNRFSHWSQFSNKKLQRVFSDNEIDYCLQIPNLSAERFAVRFAAREAFFKALTLAAQAHRIPFLTICKKIEVVHDAQKAALLKIDMVFFANRQIDFNQFSVLLSLTHTRDIATALVMIQKVHL